MITSVSPMTRSIYDATVYFVLISVIFSGTVSEKSVVFDSSADSSEISETPITVN